ncbi:suppressor of fused domain protein [uncultured Chryseobacterium sp.]|uniref:suppressor of fused domain protein n=1 Tax=uncultured Chryseobacterium sp. TaxID=259322 RepID=UPI0025EDE582|nr:suppressor of fused domain protein [uncultured Chryseobacterium sp.]
MQFQYLTHGRHEHARNDGSFRRGKPAELSVCGTHAPASEIRCFRWVTGDNPNDWLIDMLKENARFPHHYDTWLTIGHTLQATADMEPYAEQTEYTGVGILPSVNFDEDFTTIQAGENRINIYSVFPLYADEMNYKKQTDTTPFWTG